MTGKELIDYITKNDLKEKHFFIDAEGYVSTIDEIIATDLGVVLAQSGRGIHDMFSDKYNMERYFSEWFTIIPECEAKALWIEGDRSFLVLRSDGTYCCAEYYDSFSDIPTDAIFGFEEIFGSDR